MTDKRKGYVAAVIGAGPAGLCAAKALAANGVRVAILNRDIKPGGLAEYGIYYEKHKMKEGLRKQFRKILENPEISYYGNVTVGEKGALRLDDLKVLGFQGIMVAAGAQGTKWLGLPGEELEGVYHAKDLVYHYNSLPPYSTKEFKIGRRVALIGVGNVMVDIARWLIHDKKVDEVIAVARRGPAEVKFTKKEFSHIIANLDIEALEAETKRVAGRMEAVGQDVEGAKANILAALDKADPAVSNTRFRFRFLSSPARILGDENGRVVGLEVQDTELVLKNGVTKAKGLGTTGVLDVDTVIFCIGDRVDDSLGLPVEWNAFVKNPEPRFPVDGISYEAYDPVEHKPIKGVFVAGWSREASHGLVGVARKDGEHGAKALLAYLMTLEPSADPEGVIQKLEQELRSRGVIFVTNADIKRLEEIERKEAERLGVEHYKMKTNEEMLSALGLVQPSTV